MLKGPRIETKPKRVTYHSAFVDELGIKHNAKLLMDFNELVDCIYNGQEIPESYYRLGVDDGKDRLLAERGVKHLHLGGRASNTLVYLIELDDRVILLRIAGHSYLEDRPRGKTLFERMAQHLSSKK